VTEGYAPSEYPLGFTSEQMPCGFAFPFASRSRNCGNRVLTMATYEYKVVELREGLIGGKMSGEKLQKVLNEHGKGGWQLKAVTSVEVKGRIGPGGVEGVLVTFERQTS
jgi:hypothetical protein